MFISDDLKREDNQSVHHNPCVRLSVSAAYSDHFVSRSVTCSVVHSLHDYANTSFDKLRFNTKMCAAKAASNKCIKNSVYKDGKHVKEIDGNPGSIGSLGEFCGAFHHVPKRENGCLAQTSCIIGEKNNINDEPKTVVALVKFEPKEGEPFLRRYTNCYSKQKHAEEHFVHDVKANICSFGELENVTMYITLQPCHKSVSDTKGTKENWSCCDILIKLKEEELKGVKIVIKPTHLSQAGWKENEKKEGYNILIKNAEEGIKKMINSGIRLEKMKVEDWEFLWSLVENSEKYKEEIQNDRRKSLDNKINEDLEKIKKNKGEEDEEDKGEEDEEEETKEKKTKEKKTKEKLIRIGNKK